MRTETFDEEMGRRFDEIVYEMNHQFIEGQREHDDKEHCLACRLFPALARRVHAHGA